MDLSRAQQHQLNSEFGNCEQWLHMKKWGGGGERGGEGERESARHDMNELALSGKGDMHPQLM